MYIFSARLITFGSHQQQFVSNTLLCLGDSVHSHPHDPQEVSDNTSTHILPGSLPIMSRVWVYLHIVLQISHHLQLVSDPSFCCQAGSSDNKQGVSDMVHFQVSSHLTPWPTESECGTIAHLLSPSSLIQLLIVCERYYSMLYKPGILTYSTNIMANRLSVPYILYKIVSCYLITSTGSELPCRCSVRQLSYPSP